MTQSRDMPTNVDRAGLGLTLIKRSGLRIQARVQAMKSRVPLRSERRLYVAALVRDDLDLDQQNDQRERLLGWEVPILYAILYSNPFGQGKASCRMLTSLLVWNALF